MIYEYALDPTILKDWGSFRLLADGFGFSKGRVIADYPNKKWRISAFATIDTIPDQNIKKKFEIWLSERAKSAMSGRRRISANNDGPTWLTNALAEHTLSPFHAVISDQPSKESPPVLDYREAEESHPLWKVDRQCVVERTAEMIGPKVGSLLIHAREIRFVDPYLGVNTNDPKKSRIVSGCLKCLDEAKSIVETIELHVAGDKVHQKSVPYVLRDIFRDCPLYLREKVRIVRWEEGYLHNRFILTDRGGISFGDSIEESDKRPDQLTLLEDETYEKWWNRYDEARMPEHLMIANIDGV